MTTLKESAGWREVTMVTFLVTLLPHSTFSTPCVFRAVCPDKSDKANFAGSLKKKRKTGLIQKINCSVCHFFFPFSDDRFLKSRFSLRGLRGLPGGCRDKHNQECDRRTERNLKSETSWYFFFLRRREHEDFRL